MKLLWDAPVYTPALRWGTLVLKTACFWREGVVRFEPLIELGRSKRARMLRSGGMNGFVLHNVAGCCGGVRGNAGRGVEGKGIIIGKGELAVVAGRNLSRRVDGFHGLMITLRPSTWRRSTAPSGVMDSIHFCGAQVRMLPRRVPTKILTSCRQKKIGPGAAAGTRWPR